LARRSVGGGKRGTNDSSKRVFQYIGAFSRELEGEARVPKKSRRLEAFDVLAPPSRNQFR
jgi:hypothetical protein